MDSSAAAERIKAATTAVLAEKPFKNANMVYEDGRENAAMCESVGLQGTNRVGGPGLNRPWLPGPGEPFSRPLFHAGLISVKYPAQSAARKTGEFQCNAGPAISHLH